MLKLVTHDEFSEKARERYYQIKPNLKAKYRPGNDLKKFAVSLEP